MCHSCAFVRAVKGRAGQAYVLCQNEAVLAKYPQQPVFACPAYDPVAPSGVESSSLSGPGGPARPRD
jgi:hypothetical protein